MVRASIQAWLLVMLVRVPCGVGRDGSHTEHTQVCMSPALQMGFSRLTWPAARLRGGQGAEADTSLSKVLERRAAILSGLRGTRPPAYKGLADGKESASGSCTSQAGTADRLEAAHEGAQSSRGAIGREADSSPTIGVLKEDQVGSPTANDSVDGQGPDARRESQNEVDASKSSAHTLEQQIKAIFGPSEQEQRAERLAKAKKVLEVMQTKMVHELATTSS